MTIILAVGLLLGGAGGAHAAPISGCIDGNNCMWRDLNYKSGGTPDDKFVFYTLVKDLSREQWKVGGTVNDSVTSIINNGRETAYYYEHTRGQGISLVVGPRDVRWSLAVQNSDINDKITSAAFSSYVKALRS